MIIKTYYNLLLLISLSVLAQNNKKYQTFFEKGNGNQSANYKETIDFYKLLVKEFPTVKIQQMGLTDSGYPLHIVIFNPEKKFNFEAIKKNKAVILINNGIHAGEPDGIDATMMLFRDLALKKIKIPENAVIVTIPIYNIGGALNRNSTTRANQVGPEVYGFRGNGRNFDLNRDFIKSDTKNTKSFVEIFHKIDADVFLDNHVSNGADYQYKLTYIMTQHNKLGNELGTFLNLEMTPAIIKNLNARNVLVSPYVNAFEDTPDNGFAGFFESPRYTTGYTSLFNTIGFVVETHMLKKYAERVHVTYDFMVATINYTDKNYLKIKELRLKNELQYQAGKKYPLKWEIDSSKVEKIEFLGFEGTYKKSDVTTKNRLFYDTSKPYKKLIPYYKEYKFSHEIVIPKAYLIPHSWWNVIQLLKSNNATCNQLKKDTLIEVESYKIVDYKTGSTPYEGHYPHRNTKISSKIEIIKFSKGDCLFRTDQKAIKYLLETLEPTAIDSFFNWNFFDTILQQKEGYSDYVFEDLANKILNENPALKLEFEKKKQEDVVFLKNPEAQLDWVYKHSVYYEKAHLQYPVYRIN